MSERVKIPKKPVDFGISRRNGGLAGNNSVMNDPGLIRNHGFSAAPPDTTTIDAGDTLIFVQGAGAPKTHKSGSAEIIELDDGGLMVDLEPSAGRVDDQDDEKFTANLALISKFNCGMCAEELITDIESDIQSRKEWMTMREKGMELLGLKIRDSASDTGSSMAPTEGMASLDSPVLLKAALKFQANAAGELLPAEGPIKVKNNSPGETASEDMWAEILEKDLNVYVTQQLTEYYPDTKRMLFYVGFGGSGFKKVYHCALRRRPVSESVDAPDLIVDAAATDLDNAKRITHRIRMRKSMVKRMQMAGVYKNVDLGHATYTMTDEERIKNSITGVSEYGLDDKDQDRTIYECLTEYDFGEHPNRMPLPYKIVIDYDSRTVLEVRRNWHEDDPMYMPINMYVKYPYIEALGFYGLGLLHTVGNITRAATAALRLAIDSAMFANFPGLLVRKGMLRQDTNELRVPPGGAVEINGSGDIAKDIMALPYKDASAGLVGIIEKVMAMGEQVAGTPEIPVGEGMQNAPVGTVMAMIDQAGKIVDSVHKGLHEAQCKEFRMLKARLLEDPEAFWRHNKKLSGWDRETFVDALNMVELVPVADPNTPTHTHRLMKAQALFMMAQGFPQAFDMRSTLVYICRMIGYSSPEEFLKPIGAPEAPNPEMLKIQMEQQKIQSETQFNMAKIQVMSDKNKMEIMKAQLQAKNDKMKYNSEQMIEAEKLKHARMVDGAQLLSGVIDQQHAAEKLKSENINKMVDAHSKNLSTLAGLVPPPASAGPSGVAGGQPDDASAAPDNDSGQNDS